MTAAEQLKQQAREQRDQEIAVCALKEGYKPESISKLTGLSVKAVKSLKKELDKAKD